MAAGDLAVELRAPVQPGRQPLLRRRAADRAARCWTPGVERAASTGLTFSPYGLELRVLQVIARYVAGDWDGSLEAAELAGDRTPDSVVARLAAAALYVEVARGLPERGGAGPAAARLVAARTPASR